MKLGILALAALTMTGCVSIKTSEVAAPAAEPVAMALDNLEAMAIIQSRNTLYEKLVAEQDVEGLIALHTEDYTILRPGGANVEGEAAQRAYWETAFETMNGLSIDEKDVFFAGPDMIISRDTYQTLQDGYTVSTGQSVIIWKKVEGQWLVHWEMFN
ncbi:MAG: nuclear transport factor 2 family protein [Pseudomonadota bacterium]